MTRQIKKTHYERFQSTRTSATAAAEMALKKKGFDAAFQEAMTRRRRSDDAAYISSLIEGEAYLLVERTVKSGKPWFYQLVERANYSSIPLVLMSTSRMSPGELATFYMQQWQTHNFLNNGKQVYEVSPGLASRARRTELRGLNTGNLLSAETLPYDSLYITCPPEAELKVANDESGWHRVEGVYLSKDATPEGVPGWRLMVVGEPKAHERDDALFFFLVRLPEGMSLDQAIKEEVDRQRLDHPTSTQAERDMTDHLADIFRWVMNVVIYATSADARRELVWNNAKAEDLLEDLARHPSGYKHERAKRALQGANLSRRTYLGADIPLLDGVGGPGRALTVRTLVQGHWRNQAHGERHSLRKLLWIQPHWRGPDDAPVSNPTHVVV